MTALLAGRVALLVLAVVGAHRARRARGAVLTGFAGAAAAFGPGPVPLPGPVALGVGVLAAALLLAFLRADLHSPIASAAAGETAALACGAASASAFALRGGGAAEALLGAAAVGAGISVFGAAGCLANAEAGWRRGLFWAGAACLPGPVAGCLLVLGSVLPAGQRPLAPATALLVALLAWVAPLLLERRRVLRELPEEVRLGILPDEDLAVLGNPWRRRREARFGRADERREYVRSALLLAVARQQQRRRTGEAIRLRQLEVLAFRTRVRRAVEGRLARFGGAADEPAL